MIIKLDQSDLNKCKKFVIEYISAQDGNRLYVSRGESKAAKISEDIFVGKMGEVAVEKYFNNLGWKVSKGTDFEIYEKKHKSYSSDLVVHPSFEPDPFMIHVKTQTQASLTRYGISYLFQRNDPLVVSPTNKDYIACTSKISESEIEILGFMSLESIIRNNLIGECKVPSYRTTKVALYVPKNSELFVNFHIHLE